MCEDGERKEVVILWRAKGVCKNGDYIEVEDEEQEERKKREWGECLGWRQVSPILHNNTLLLFISQALFRKTKLVPHMQEKLFNMSVL